MTAIKKKRIALFEPVETAQIFLQQLLERLSYRVDLFSCLEQFPKRSSGRKMVDLVILNLSMLGDTFHKVLQRLPELRIDPPSSMAIIALTDLNLSSQAHRQLEKLGISVVLPHKSHWMELLFEVNRLLFSKICELRNYNRIFGGFPVQFHERERWQDGIVYNISQQGAFIQCDRPPPEKKTLQIRLTLPNGERRLEVQAIVNWTTDTSKGQNQLSPPGMGVHFLTISAEDHASLVQFISSKMG